MFSPAVRSSLFVIIILTSSFPASAAEQSSHKPLRASQVLALEAGGALQGNIAHDISVRGLNFRPDEDFLSMMTAAGADATLISTIKTARVDGDATPDKKLLQQLTDAAVLMNKKQYAEAGAKLSEALEVSFARMETGFAMAELLRQQENYAVAASVYGEILQAEPDFPEVHDKASFVLYRLGDQDNALSEANAALEQNANDAEAHKNKGLVLQELRKFEGALAEYREALRIKPDYVNVYSDLGLLHDEQHAYAESIAEYKKALALDPTWAKTHYDLGIVYMHSGNTTAAIAEYREAKRLNPDDPAIRQNLASALMPVAPNEAIVELRELEQKFPNFELCHICLGRALAGRGDNTGATEQFRKAIQLDPGDPNGYLGLGRIQEDQKNYDGALEEYRAAAQMFPNEGETHQAVGRVLLAKKDYSGAVQELKQAENLSGSSWQVHELYGRALEASGENELAIAQFNDALALNPEHPYLLTELGSALEKKGDWVGAFEQHRKAIRKTEEIRLKALSGSDHLDYSKECNEQYRAAQGRFADYLVALKTSGHNAEAAELEKRVSELDSSAGRKEKAQMALHAGDQAFQQRNLEEAITSYKQAVELAESLRPSDEILLVALRSLGTAYGQRLDVTNAAAAFHRQLAVAEKTFGPESGQSVQALIYLAHLAASQENYKEAESYMQRAVDITLKTAGDNSSPAVETLGFLGKFYMMEKDWPKAETYLLRAVKGAEATEGMVYMPLWGLCQVYDGWDKPEKAQPCWHRATELLAEQSGQNSPNLVRSLTNEANAWRKLGKTSEAQAIEERISGIQKLAAHVN
jgi:tetratricopeptide (TPR) repeat protein